MEIVRTTSTAENAISVLATTPNFDFFIDLSLSSVEVHQQSHLEVAGEQRLTTVVSRSTGTAYVCSSGTDWERDWELRGTALISRRGRYEYISGSKSEITVGSGQYHLAVAGGCAAMRDSPHTDLKCYAPTRYREVVLTRPKYVRYPNKKSDVMFFEY